MIEELREVQERVHAYHDGIEQSLQFADRRSIDDNRLILYFMMMSILWTASSRRDEITIDDVEIYTNQDLRANFDEKYVNSLQFPTLAGIDSIPLEEFLDYIHQTYFG